MQKLSEAQLRILQVQADHQGDRMYSFGDSFHWVGAYATGPRIDRRSAKRLLEEGCIERLDTDGFCQYFNITEAGRRALEEEDARHKEAH